MNSPITGTARRRTYNQFVARESIEDYALRYTPSSFRRWSEFTVSNTAIGGISFLALEAIGASIAISYGFENAFWGILVAAIIIFVLGFPICYQAAKNNIDIDLLTRAAGFGYLGSTATSLIYASFCYIFFALEAAIMAQALLLYTGLPLYIGYVICSIIIIPIVFYGMTAINRLQLITQPVWLVLMILPFIMVLLKEPAILDSFFGFSGTESGTAEFSYHYFGFAIGISLALIPQIGEQVDYLRFMPEKTRDNQFKWWAAVVLTGPGWIILGFLKQIGGVLLAALVLIGGASVIEAKEPIYMYNAAYTYVFDHPGVALAVSFIFVMVSQIKINVTNAYAGSLAWSNFFSRTTHTHPGRVVWLVFNTAVALLLMEIGVFEVLAKILGLYSNIAIAWITTMFADLAINKPLGLSPKLIEFRRAHLFNINPVGIFSTLFASVISIIAFSGMWGADLQAFSSIVALVTALILTPFIAWITGGRYYIARQSEGFEEGMHTCGVCHEKYTAEDMATCAMYSTNICALCCSLDARCHDMCKVEKEFSLKDRIVQWIIGLSGGRFQSEGAFRFTDFLLIFTSIVTLIGFILWTTYMVRITDVSAADLSEIQDTYWGVFSIFALVSLVGVWVIVLMKESREYVENELTERNADLENEITQRKLAEAELSNISETASEAIITMNTSSEILSWNAAATHIFGHAAEEAIGQQIYLIIPDHLRQSHAEGLARISNGGDLKLGGKTLELEGLNKSGQIFPIEMSLAAWTGENGQIFCGILRDITERKTAERAIINAMDQIHESIRYASRIQRSVLPDPKVLEDVFADHIVIWEPKDVVGGDLYLYRKCDTGHLLMLVDCTGHGVPGAFMTMLVTGALDHALVELPSGNPAAILNRINYLVKMVLGQDTADGESDDGFECGLCLIDDVAKAITFAGARFELWSVIDNELAVVKGDKVGIGYRRTKTDFPFTNHILPIANGTRLYMTSDGLIDQVGGEEQRSFGKRRLKELILGLGNLKMADQGTVILKELAAYQGDQVRRDDIALFGFRPKL